MMAMPAPITMVAAYSTQTSSTCPAQARRHPGDQQAGHQGRQRAEARDQQRAGQRRDGEQNERKAGENPDLGPGQMQIGLDQRR